MFYLKKKLCTRTKTLKVFVGNLDFRAVGEKVVTPPHMGSNFKIVLQTSAGAHSKAHVE